MFKNLKLFGIAMLFALLAAALVACGGDNNNDNNGNGDDEEKTAEDFGDDVDWTITGIDPGAGIMNNTETAIDEYGLDDWTLEESSESAMLAELQTAYDNEEPIIIPGWKPHQMFEQFDLTMLEDPKEIYGGDGDEILAIGNKDFAETSPGAAKVIERFAEFYDTDVEQDLLVDINVEDEDPEDVADDFLEENDDLLEEWTEGVGDEYELGEEDVTLTYIAWAGALARTPLLAKVLEEAGYTVDQSQMEAGPAWQAVADDPSSVLTAAWLPATHADYWDEYEDDVEELGTFVDKAPLALTVPDYVVEKYGIESVEDLKK